MGNFVENVKKRYRNIWDEISTMRYANRFATLIFLGQAILSLLLLIVFVFMGVNDELTGQFAIGTGILNQDIWVLTINCVIIVGLIVACHLVSDQKWYKYALTFLMILLNQFLFVEIGEMAISISYIIIIATCIFAEPSFTLVMGALTFVIGLKNWIMFHQGQISEDMEKYRLVSEKSSDEYLYFLLFYLPIITVAATLIAYCMKKLIRYYTEYSARNTRQESNNKAAAGIQNQILASSFIHDTAKEDVTIIPFIKTADYVAGDFYDYYSVDRNHICILIADVSGKGLAAGMFMMRAKEVLKVQSIDHQDPARLMRRANDELCENNRECMFATAWLGILDLRTGEMQYCNGGHNSPLMIYGNRVAPINEVSGPALGLFPNKTYTSHKLKLGIGDRVLLYTDGVTEQPIGDNHRYDEKGLIQFIHDNSDTDNLCEAIYEDIARYNMKQFDDITMLQLRFDNYRHSTSKVGRAINDKCFLSAEPQSIRSLRRFVVDNLNTTNISKEFINTFYVACEEMVTNVIKYAYGGTDNNGGVSVELIAQDDYVAIIIEDSGVSFNPFTYDKSVVANKSDSLTIGGRGIKIFTEIMDEYIYDRKADCNIVKAKKYMK